MNVKTSELTGPALDYAVMVCLHPNNVGKVEFFHELRNRHALHVSFHYSTDWSQGGPIIERERILIQPEIGKEGCGNAWNAISMADTEAYGPTPLVAAMRCYVASKLGDEVDVPDELRSK